MYIYYELILNKMALYSVIFVFESAFVTINA